MSAETGLPATAGRPFVLLVQGRLKEGQLPAFVEAFKPLAAHVTKEETGTLAYQLSFGEEPDSLLIYERYISKEYLETVHWQAEPFKAFKVACEKAGIEWVSKQVTKYHEVDVGYMLRQHP